MIDTIFRVIFMVKVVTAGLWRHCMKNKIINIREKYDWQNLYEIILSSKTDLSDRLFMILMCLWFIPAKLFIRLVWLILFIPALLFSKTDNILNQNRCQGYISPLL
jgi:hypothetical protein